MAVYKANILDVELNTGNIARSFLCHNIGKDDTKADRFGVRVYRDGEPESLSGCSIQGYMMRPNGTNLAITGSNTGVSGNEAWVDLPQAAYDYEGQFCLALKLIGGGVTGTIRIIDGMINNTFVDDALVPMQSVPTYQEILAVYDQMVAAKNGSVRFDQSQSLTETQKSVARMNIDAARDGDVSDLKSAFDNIAEEHISRNMYNPADLKVGINILPTGAETPNAGYSCTDFLPIDGVVCISSTIGYDIGAAGGRVLLYDSTKTLIPDGSYDVSQNSYTSDSALQRNYWAFTGTNAKYVRLRGLNAMWADGYKIQIEASSTHTAYVAYTPPTFAIKDGTITAAMFAEGAVQDALNYYGTIETITGGYYKTYTKDFVQGKSYLITLVNKTDSAPIVFYGVIEGTNRASVFTLDGGQSYLFTPTRNFIGLYWGSAGSYTITINNMDGFEEKLPHVFYCGENREYKTLKSAIEAATLYMGSVLYVDAGTYDIIQEFGDDYFAGLTSTATSLGIQLKNRIHIIFSPNSKVVCHYTGDNQYACSVFSPFHVFEYGFTIENLNLECSRVRYAFHDERNGGVEQCQSIYKNCRMVIDNSQNEYWNSKTCIGGGLGSNHEVRIEDCIFDVTDSGLNAGVYYHQSNNTSNPNHKANITIKDCYFVNGTVILQMTRTDATDDTNIIITNNNFPNIAQADSEGLYLNGMTASHVNVFVWNNKKRTA